MTVFKSKYQRQAFIAGLLFLASYLFQDFLYGKTWLLSGAIMILLGIVSTTITIIGFIKRDKNILIILAILILTITLTEITKSEIFKSEKILEARLDDDLSYIQLILRKDSSFQMTSITMFSDTTCKGKYKLNKDKIIFLDKPNDNDFIPDTVTVIGDKIILGFDSSGKPRTDFATFFSIEKNKLRNGP